MKVTRHMLESMNWISSVAHQATPELPGFYQQFTIDLSRVADVAQLGSVSNGSCTWMAISAAC